MIDKKEILEILWDYQLIPRYHNHDDLYWIEEHNELHETIRVVIICPDCGACWSLYECNDNIGYGVEQIDSGDEYCLGKIGEDYFYVVMKE